MKKRGARFSKSNFEGLPSSLGSIKFCHASPSGSLMFLNEESPFQFKMVDTLKWRSLCSQERQLRSDNCNGQVPNEDLRDDLSNTILWVIDHV